MNQATRGKQNSRKTLPGIITCDLVSKDPASFIASSFNCFLGSFVVFEFCFCPAAMLSAMADDLNLLTIEEADELLLGEDGEAHMDDIEELLGEDPPRQRSRSPRS